MQRAHCREASASRRGRADITAAIGSRGLVIYEVDHSKVSRQIGKWSKLSFHTEHNKMLSNIMTKNDRGYYQSRIPTYILSINIYRFDGQFIFDFPK